MEKPGNAFGQAFFGSYLSCVSYIYIYVHSYIYIYYGYTMLYKLGQQPCCHLASKSWDHGTRGTPQALMANHDLSRFFRMKIWPFAGGTWSLSDRPIVKATAALRQVTHPCAWNFWTAMRTRLGSVLSVKQCLYMFYIGMIGMMCSPQIPWNHKLVQEGQHMWLGCSSPWEVNDSHKDTKLVHCADATWDWLFAGSGRSFVKSRCWLVDFCPCWEIEKMDGWKKQGFVLLAHLAFEMVSGFPLC